MWNHWWNIRDDDVWWDFAIVQMEKVLEKLFSLVENWERDKNISRKKCEVFLLNHPTEAILKSTSTVEEISENLRNIAKWVNEWVRGKVSQDYFHEKQRENKERKKVEKEVGFTVDENKMT